MKKKFEHNFLDKFLGHEPITPDKQSKSTVHHDKWDEEDKNQLLEEMRAFSVAEDRITDVAATGGSAFADLYYSLVKAMPKLKDPTEVRPSYLVNRAVLGESMSMKEWEDLRSYCTGDSIGAAMSCVSMEPELEILFDKLKQEQKMAQQLEEQMQQAAGLSQESADLDEMMRQALEEDPNSKDVPNWQKDQARIQEALQKLQEKIEQGSADLAEQLKNASPGMQMSLRSMMNEAIDDAKNMEGLQQMWGLEPGALVKMPPAERIELAQRINTPKFRKIVEIFGPMQRLAFAEQMRKTIHARDEIYDLSKGNDLSRVLPMELMTIRHPLLKWDVIRKYLDEQLLQYELRGQERVAKGGIIFCEDGSGSMAGQPEMWAKAVGLCMLHIAKSQNRAFHGIHFGSPGQIAHFDFHDTKAITVDQVISFAEIFFNGGTDFHTPLSKALDILKEEHAATGHVSGDIVFCTDGICGVDENWLAEFKKQQAALGFRVFGIAIGCPYNSEPLYTICDHRVITIADIVSGNDIREIFRDV